MNIIGDFFCYYKIYKKNIPYYNLYIFLKEDYSTKFFIKDKK